jgi:hypothetical protein
MSNRYRTLAAVGFLVFLAAYLYRTFSEKSLKLVSWRCPNFAWVMNSVAPS